MKFSEQYLQAIIDVISGFVTRVIDSATEEDPFDEMAFRTRRPFDAALVPMEIWKGSHFERKFVTARGQVGFERIAKIVALNAGHQAELNRVTNLDIFQSQLNEINATVSALRQPRRTSGVRPDWPHELQRVMVAAHGPVTITTVISDLYVCTHDGRELFFSLKSSKPNIDQTQIAKQDILKLRASKSDCEAYFALPDNPYGRRQDYAWSFGNQIFDMRHDPVVLIGEEFWDYIGGDGTFEALISLFEEVGEQGRRRIESEYLFKSD